VDQQFGNDTNGRATNGPYLSIHTNLYFATISKALQQVTATNNAIYGHNDPGGAVIYLKSTVTNWMGGTDLTYGSESSPAWVTIMPYNNEIVHFNLQSGARRASNALAFYKVTFGGSASYFANQPRLWFDQCVFSNSSAGLAQSSKLIWATRCSVSNFTQGFKANSSEETYWMCVGNFINNLNVSCQPRLFVGNLHTSIDSSLSFATEGNGQSVTHDWLIYYNNYLGGLNLNGAAVIGFGNSSGITSSLTNGAAFVQNICEITTNGVSASYSFFGNNTNHYTNFIFWNNVMLGKRIAGFGYNNSGTTVAYRYYWSTVGNIFDNVGLKTDTESVGSGNRIGNWPVMWMVGASGNFFQECDTSGVDSPGAFNPEFNGINCYHPVGSQTNETTFIRFKDRRSQGGSYSPPPGNGDYRLHTTSPARLLKVPVKLRFDINGYTRGTADPPGAHAAGSGRKAAFF